MSAGDQARGGNHGSQSPLEDDQARAWRGRSGQGRQKRSDGQLVDFTLFREPSDAVGWRRRSRHDLWISASGNPPRTGSRKRRFSAA